MGKKQGTPSWKKFQSQGDKKNIYNAEGEQQQDDNDRELASQFKNLQQYWDSLQSNPKGIPRCCSFDTKCPVAKSLPLFHDSPQKLMSSLQRTTMTTTSSTPEGVWKVRTNDLAVEEILRERKAAIQSGKLKGRRLFLEGATEMDLGYSDWSDLVQDNGKKTPSSAVSSSVSSAIGSDGTTSNCCSCSECGGGAGGDMERNKGVSTEKNVGEKRDGSGRKCGVFRGWVCIALAVVILGFILLGSMNGDGGRDEVFLVPT